MPLSDAQVRNAKPLNKPYKLADEKGLYLLVTPTNAKSWRYKFRFNGKEKLLALGLYPEVNVSEARERRNEARKLLDRNIDPSVTKQVAKQTAKISAENSFELIAREWYEKFKNTWAESYKGKVLGRLENHLFPWVRHRPISEIMPRELLEVLNRAESLSGVDTAHRLRNLCNQIFRYAIASARAERNPSAELQGALTPKPKKHYATITEPEKIGELLIVTDGYRGSFTTKCALKLAPLLFVRPGELRTMEWKEIDFKTATWRIPPEKMKMEDPHIVPLAKQSLAILQELHQAAGASEYVFPSAISARRPMSDNTVNTALRRLDYTKEEITGHGFRSMASTRLNELGWHPDVIERQLSHTERNSVRAAYNYAQYLPERRKMMQAWADYLDKLKKEAQIKVTAHKAGSKKLAKHLKK